MTEEKFLMAMNEIDDGLIEESETAAKKVLK